MNTIYKKDKYQQQEDLLKKLKQRLEDSWSGFTQVVEELEEFNCSVNDAEETRELSDSIHLRLENFYDNYLDDIKYQAEKLQDETQQAIDRFEYDFNLTKEV
tara:strand:+ start:201 stop:506 length:306 start_codon:yes stop_codon:yes gene_type:complete